MYCSLLMLISPRNTLLCWYVTHALVAGSVHTKCNRIQELWTIFCLARPSPSCDGSIGTNFLFGGRDGCRGSLLRQRTG